MFTAEIIYKGDLRTEATHLKSGKSFITDAPTDNHGKGEAFSPTDTICAALASCMLTLMGIGANRHNLNIDGTKVQVLKHMADNPRRISKIDVIISFGQNSFSSEEKKILERFAITCPVAKSLHPDIEQAVTFNY
jgi:putative redox protein